MVLGKAGGDGGGARVSMARRLGEAAAASKLEMGAARSEHPVFMVGKQRGAQGKEGGVGGVDSDSKAAECPAWT